uniref:Oxysterol-binding protein n=1 Tax=Electrophorus electricus TaxID=8005 RepID=A0A4W4G4W1_ELEEL
TSSEEKSSSMSQKISSPSRSNSSSSSKHDSRQVSKEAVCAYANFCELRSVFVCVCIQDSWEIVEGLRGCGGNIQDPERQEGYMLKKRKWPMKGWHKRYFILDKGILKYAKSSTDIEKGKLHGCIDVGLSVMAIKNKTKCIDLDAEENIYHLKIKSQELFDEWVSKLRHHRLYRQNEISMFPQEKALFSPHCSPSSPVIFAESQTSRKVTQLSPHTPLLLPTHGCSDPFYCFSPTRSISLSLSLSLSLSPPPPPELSECETQLLELNHLLRSMEVLHRTCSAPAINALQVTPPFRLQCFMLAARSSNKARGPVTPLGTGYWVQPMNVRGVQDAAAPILSVDCARSLVHQTSDDSQTSITESMSEFFDAQEVLVSASSSENEVRTLLVSCHTVSQNGSSSIEQNGAPQGRRRATLPSPCPSASTISLWNILKNNIGKDLSKVAMPVQLNEPLNTLQRLCEELEYSELLDRAALTQDPFERMVYIATFAVSGYAASYYRAGGKPFNPLLGETYECERPEKGFRFIAEQVSHHPPISACHADSKNFIFWQDMRWKNKFWGKSMEIVPVGTTHVVLPGLGDHYEWNKVTSCIHNIMSGQRWIEHYGELSIKNAKSNICQCKVTFKAKYWNSSVNEVDGSVLDQKGKVIHKLFGKWHESIYWGNPPTATCVWRANPMPPEHEQYYGFTKFALELNELDAQTKPLLPPTDTRLRLDQRLLEEGNVEEAEIQKQRIEQMQRDRRKVLEENDMEHEPRFFQKSTDDTWISNNTYWDLRKEPGFSNLDFPVLW